MIAVFRTEGKATAWIESHQSLMSHHKTRKASRLLAVRPVHLIGHLHALWWWALDYADDGDVTRFDAEDIAEAAEWEDNAEAFVAALTECGPGGAPGFLELTDDGRLLIHDWWDYAGKLVERRRADAERKRSARHSNEGRRTSSGHPADGAESPSVTVTVTNRDPDQPTKPEPEDEARVAAPLPTAAPKPPRIKKQYPVTTEAYETADVLAECSWINDEPLAIEQAVARSFAYVPEFSTRDGPLNAAKFTSHHAKKPPADWYRAWLNWIKNAVEFAKRDAAQPRGKQPVDINQRVHDNYERHLAVAERRAGLR